MRSLVLPHDIPARPESDVCNRCDLPRYVTQTLFSASLLDDEHET